MQRAPQTTRALPLSAQGGQGAACTGSGNADVTASDCQSPPPLIPNEEGNLGVRGARTSGEKGVTVPHWRFHDWEPRSHPGGRGGRAGTLLALRSAPRASGRHPVDQRSGRSPLTEAIAGVCCPLCRAAAPRPPAVCPLLSLRNATRSELAAEGGPRAADASIVPVACGLSPRRRGCSASTRPLPPRSPHRGRLSPYTLQAALLLRPEK